MILAMLAATGSFADAQGVPPDFRLHYAWKSATVAPPGYYGFDIDMAASGNGTVAMWGSSPMRDEPAPLLRGEFEVSASSLQALRDSAVSLHGQLVEAGKRPCPKQRFKGKLVCAPLVPSPTVGGPSCRIDLVSDGKPLAIPCNDGAGEAGVYKLPPGFEESRAAFVRSIEVQVPVATWQRLRGGLEEFQQRIFAKEAVLRDASPAN